MYEECFSVKQQLNKRGKLGENEISNSFMNSIVFSEFNGVYRILICMTIIAWKGCGKTRWKKNKVVGAVSIVEKCKGCKGSPLIQLRLFLNVKYS